MNNKRPNGSLQIIVALLLCLVGVLFGILVLFPSKFDGFSDKLNLDDIEIVIARYNESLDWIAEVPFNDIDITVYNKGPNPDFTKTPRVQQIIPLENVGKCDHTYLYHIVANYDRLRDITIFLPGSTNMEYKKTKAIKILESIKNSGKAAFLSDGNHENLKKELYDFALDEWTTSDGANKLMNPEKIIDKSEIRPFGKWFESNFGDIAIKYVTYGGIFSVAKSDILRHPREYYEQFLSQLSMSSNPEVGHYIERSWAAIFHPMNDTIVYTDYSSEKYPQ